MLRIASISFLAFLAVVGSGISRVSLDEASWIPRSALEQDSLALVAFAEENNRWLWTRGRNWLSGPLDTWFGVTVTDGRVTHLELPENNVIGNLPDKIGDLSALKVLDLSSNFMSGDIPTSINQLANLEILDLEENSFLSFPDSLGGMQQLRVFDVSGSYIQEDLPQDITTLSKLEILDLSHGGLFDLPDLSVMRAFGVLRRLDVSHNFLRFDDIEPNLSVAQEFLYDNQVAGSTTLTGFENEPVILQGAFAGRYNQYKWVKRGVPIAGQQTDRLVLSDFQQSDSGTYVLEVTNRRATRLTIRHVFRVEFDSRRRLKWLDIGDYQHPYDFHGRNTPNERGMVYPGFQRYASHGYSRNFWVGAKDWVDTHGELKSYRVFRSGPSSRLYGITPIDHKLIGRFEDTVVEVNGRSTEDLSKVLDEVDPTIPADRMIQNVFTTALGLTVERRAYAYANAHHDDYHILSYTFCNTGNDDWDEEIELPGQTLNGVYFYWNHRWAGTEQAGWGVGSPTSVWGKQAMHDVVGDGNQDYPVDFTAVYGWNGFDPEYDAPFLEYDNLGAPLVGRTMNEVIRIEDLIAPGDTLGRLADPNMVGRITLHADRSTEDRTYDRGQPSRIGWIASDWYTNYDGEGSAFLYQYQIEGGFDEPRTYPHFADTVEPTGRFWDSQTDPSMIQHGGIGGFSPQIAYGPYDMPFGSCINVAAADGIAGLSYDAAVDIGRAYATAGQDRDAELIPYDANGDGEINTTPFDYDQVFVGTELQTKNQWVMSARDSLFNTFFRARDLYRASGEMAQYPIVEPPRPPQRFSVWGRDEGIVLEWQPAAGGPTVTGWEIYRTEGWVDNLYASGCLDDPNRICAYEHVASLPVSAVSYLDVDVGEGVDYYYYVQAVGEPQAVDPHGIAGTPDGQPLRSGRYFTQTYDPVRLSSAPPQQTPPTDKLVLETNFPNPFAGNTSIRYGLPKAADVNLSVYDMLGRQVAVLVQQFQLGGQYEVQFDAGQLASGVYVYVLDTGAERIERTMLLVQ